MTHSNHRRGSYANLSNDYVIMFVPGRIMEDLVARVEQFVNICRWHRPVNQDYPMGWYAYVYDSKEKVTGVLKDLVDADLGLSVVVSGLFNEVEECCCAAGTFPHTVNHSLGFWGKVDKLPHERILEFTTMCGHGLISSNLVYHLAKKVQRHAMSIGDAAQEMGRPCFCNIFNPVRTEELLRKLVADLEAGILSETDLNLRGLT